MNKLLPVNYKDNIIKKLFSKIRNIFFRKRKIQKEITEDNEIQLEQNIEQNENNFKSNLKADSKFYNKEIQQINYLKKIYNNPELLNNFPTEKLEVILEYIQKENKMKKAKLANLNS